MGVKPLGKKAKTKIDIIEQEYIKIYGRLSDYDYAELWKQYGAAMAGKIIQDRIDKIWSDMKEQNSPTFKTTENNPFEIESDY